MLSAVQGNFQLRFTLETIITLSGFVALLVGCCTLASVRCLRGCTKGRKGRINPKVPHKGQRARAGLFGYACARLAAVLPPGLAARLEPVTRLVVRGSGGSHQPLAQDDDDAVGEDDDAQYDEPHATIDVAAGSGDHAGGAARAGGGGDARGRRARCGGAKGAKSGTKKGAKSAPAAGSAGTLDVAEIMEDNDAVPPPPAMTPLPPPPLPAGNDEWDTALYGVSMAHRSARDARAAEADAASEPWTDIAAQPVSSDGTVVDDDCSPRELSAPQTVLARPVGGRKGGVMNEME